MTLDVKDQVEDFIRYLARATQISRNYGKKHRMTLGALNDLYETLDTILFDRDNIVVGVIGDEIAFEKEPLFKLSRTNESFIQLLKKLGIEKLQFSLEIKKYEIEEFVNALAGHITFSGFTKDIQSYLLTKNVKHIQVERIHIKDNKDDYKDLDQLTQNCLKNGISFLEETTEAVEHDQPIDMKSLRKISSNLVKSMLYNANLLLLLASIRFNKEDLLVHNLNVCVFTLMQAEMLGLEKGFLVHIGEAALLHNMGDLIDAQGNDKNNKALSASNSDIRSFRADKGAKTLLQTKGIHVLAPITSFEYHIKYDRSGISWKIFGEKLNLVSMMIAISKFYDTERRKSPYEKESRPENVYKEMKKRSGKDFHPDLLKNFFSGLGVYPPGTLVELDSGEICLVIQRSILKIKRPKVEILYDKSGDKYRHSSLINLQDIDQRGEYRLSIVRSVSPNKEIQLPEKYTKMVDSG